MTGKNEYHLAISDAQRRVACEGLFVSFYKHVPEEKVVFDTNRVWCAKIADLNLLFPDARIVCCVRSLAWVLDRFEKLAQANPLYCYKTFNFDPTGTVYSHAHPSSIEALDARACTPLAARCGTSSARRCCRQICSTNSRSHHFGRKPTMAGGPCLSYEEHTTTVDCATR